jgi:hypothetical protein
LGNLSASSDIPHDSYWSLLSTVMLVDFDRLGANMYIVNIPLSSHASRIGSADLATEDAIKTRSIPKSPVSVVIFPDLSILSFEVVVRSRL